MGEIDRFVPSPLSPLIVLDFTHALAGPYCTMLLASYGLEMAWHLGSQVPGGGQPGTLFSCAGGSTRRSWVSLDTVPATAPTPLSIAV